MMLGIDDDDDITNVSELEEKEEEEERAREWELERFKGERTYRTDAHTSMNEVALIIYLLMEQLETLI